MTAIALLYLAVLSLVTVALGAFSEGRALRRLLLAAGCVGVALAMAAVLS